MRQLLNSSVVKEQVLGDQGRARRHDGQDEIEQEVEYQHRTAYHGAVLRGAGHAGWSVGPDLRRPGRHFPRRNRFRCASGTELLRPTGRCRSSSRDPFGTSAALRCLSRSASRERSPEFYALSSCRSDRRPVRASVDAGILFSGFALSGREMSAFVPCNSEQILWSSWECDWTSGRGLPRVATMQVSCEARVTWPMPNHGFPCFVTFLQTISDFGVNPTRGRPCRPPRPWRRRATASLLYVGHGDRRAEPGTARFG